jgi:hypothetical protein
LSTQREAAQPVRLHPSAIERRHAQLRRRLRGQFEVPVTPRAYARTVPQIRGRPIARPSKPRSGWTLQAGAGLVALLPSVALVHAGGGGDDASWTWSPIVLTGAVLAVVLGRTAPAH